MATPLPQKIDVHCHYLTPAYRQACIENGHANPDGMPYLPEWSVDDHLKLMNDLGISKSIISVSSPGTHLVAGNGELAAKVAREVNSYAADLKKKMPDRFGYWASLPMPDIDVCLEEIAQATEEGCDGFVLESNSHGEYLGNESLNPIFDELNRRRATIFIHPTTPICPCSPKARAQGQQPVKAAPFAGKYPNPMLEFMFDTARAVTNLFLSGTIRRCPNIRIILPHLGGAMPPLLSRWSAYSTFVPVPWEDITEEEVREAFKTQIWFDLAGFPFPGQIVGLMQGCGVPHSRLMYGSDWPFTRRPGVDRLAVMLDDGVKGMFNTDEIEDIYHRNAEKLLGSTKP
ncbi:hypothetical protein BAUCODRAFT_251053 [Baudoinia panamericana UAMH 10762]|uniref:6-methylsalicylate decarboxylase n=1 Tax=Baudoinia panamericana (strain UAMH 10762) TaxID=717646 RepID=M2LHQ2_BAUPA|nr:uncharacterized protein BAUCODRAFT_251053 [Baudoinia panamericana UAMH 10762]EMC93697.1 hypothetical protein BAUCODRAFT_251053 [Baudoinia panamericana UAMH 10762]